MDCRLALVEMWVASSSRIVSVENRRSAVRIHEAVALQQPHDLSNPLCVFPYTQLDRGAEGSEEDDEQTLRSFLDALPRDATKRDAAVATFLADRIGQRPRPSLVRKERRVLIRHQRPRP